MKKILLTAIIALVSLSASADDIALGIPSYGGTGCPQGTVGASLSPDSKVLSVIFDQYMAQAGKALTIDRKACNLAVPIHVPQGWSVSILKIDYRGYGYVPAGAMARFDVEYFLKSFSSNTAGPKAAKTFMGPYDDTYLLTNQLALTGMVWSACGEDVNLRVNSSIMAKTNSKKQDVLATVDSVDIAAGMIFSLQWRQCF